MITRKEVNTIVKAAMFRVSGYAKASRCAEYVTIDCLRTVLDTLQDVGHISSYGIECEGENYPDGFTLKTTLKFKEKSKPVVLTCNTVGSIDSPAAEVVSIRYSLGVSRDVSIV